MERQARVKGKGDCPGRLIFTLNLLYLIRDMEISGLEACEQMRWFIGVVDGIGDKRDWFSYAEKLIVDILKPNGVFESPLSSEWPMFE